MDVSSDVVENILTRSDVKDLLRCKSVCKSWCSLISSPYFVKAHLKHNICNSNDNDAGHTRIAMPKVWKIPNDNNETLYQDTEYAWKVVGSSIGLVCVFFSVICKDPLLVLVNPLTREVRELPMAPLLPEKIEPYEVSASFAYDSSSDDYKVVMGYKKNVDEAVVHVLSLKSNTWKLIGHINYWFRYGLPGVFLNGALHWFAYDNKTTYNYISGQPSVLLSFDLSREEFKEIPKPYDSRYIGNSYSTLGIFEDNLCISCEDGYGPYYRIWIMRNYNVKQSWEFLPNDYKMKSDDVVHYMNFYDCTSPKKKRMTFYCDDKTVLSRSGKHIIDAPIFVQSLVSPYVNCDKPSHAGSAKVAERECHQMRVFERRKKYQYDAEISRMREVYWREGGHNEKSYLREGIEAKRKRRQRKDKIHMQEKRSIMEILIKDERGGGENKRPRKK